MNYYPHNIGDYAAATGHLSALEDCFYRRMLDRYYQTEEPLPADPARLCKLVRAVTKPERAAVAAIADEFFMRDGDVLRQGRCDAEIAVFQEKSAKAKRSADARWNAQPSHNERNANAPPNAMRTHCEGNAIQNQDTETETTKDKSSCAEPAPQAPAPVVLPMPVISLATNTGKPWHVYAEVVSDWKTLFPAVDVMQCLRTMKAWLDANPTKRKTQQGMKRFVVSWLSREQDRGGMLGHAGGNVPRGPLAPFPAAEPRMSGAAAGLK